MVDMSIITNMLERIKLPEMIQVRQSFNQDHIENMEIELRQILDKGEMVGEIRSDMSVAITAGSRGICNISAILRILVDEVRKRGAYPFIVPAMGSNSGGTV